MDIMVLFLGWELFCLYDHYSTAFGGTGQHSRHIMRGISRITLLEPQEGEFVLRR